MILINQQCWAQSTTHHLTNNHGERMKDGKFESCWSKCENEIIGTSQAWDKEKIWVPNRIQTYDLPNTGRVLYPLELWRTHGEWGHILGSYLTCVLHTARISNVEIVMYDERMKDGKFEARWNKCEKEINSIFVWSSVNLNRATKAFDQCV